MTGAWGAGFDRGTDATMEHSDETRAIALRMLLENGARMRFAMRGRSMLPLLREPMVLEVERNAPVRFGDVLVFRGPEKTTAHRVIRRVPGAWITGGDAQGWCERVADADVLGRVVAVRRDATPGAPRVDTMVWHARGRARALRHFAVLAYRSLVRRVAGPTPFAALIAALAAARRNDRRAFIAACSDVKPDALTAIARRHGCVGLLADARRRFGIQQADDAFARARWASALRSGRYETAVADVVRVLAAAQLRFVLLKGAARTYARVPNAALHLSGDIDVMLDPDDIDAARERLGALGYYPSPTWSMYALHHHEVPLVAPERPPVELHTALAPPGHFSLPLDTRSMLARTRAVDGPAGRALVFDDAATVLHLCVHAFGLWPLRDLVLAGEALARLSGGERDALAREIAAETREATRLRTAFAVAGALAGIPVASTPQVRRYASWAARREQLPTRLYHRAHIADALAAGAPVENRAYWTTPVRALAKMTFTALLLLWALALPRQQLHLVEPVEHGRDVVIDDVGGRRVD